MLARVVVLRREVEDQGQRLERAVAAGDVGDQGAEAVEGGGQGEVQLVASVRMSGTR